MITSNLPSELKALVEAAIAENKFNVLIIANMRDWEKFVRPVLIGSIAGRDVVMAARADSVRVEGGWFRLAIPSRIEAALRGMEYQSVFVSTGVRVGQLDIFALAPNLPEIKFFEPSLEKVGR